MISSSNSLAHYSLPKEILITISQYFSVQEQRIFRIVCKTWNDQLTNKDIPISIKQLKGLKIDNTLEILINDNALSGKAVIDSCTIKNRSAFLLREPTRDFLLVSDHFLINRKGLIELPNTTHHSKLRVRFINPKLIVILADRKPILQYELKKSVDHTGKRFTFASAPNYPIKNPHGGGNSHAITSLIQLFTKNNLFQTYLYANESIEVLDASGRKIAVLPSPTHQAKPDEFLMKVKKNILLVSVKVSEASRLAIYDISKASLISRITLKGFDKDNASFLVLKDRLIIPVTSRTSQLLTLISYNHTLLSTGARAINTQINVRSIIKVVSAADKVILILNEIDALKIKFLLINSTPTALVEDSIALIGMSSLDKVWVVENRYLGIKTADKATRIIYIDAYTRSIVNDMTFDDKRHIIGAKNGKFIVHQVNKLSFPKNPHENSFKVACKGMIRTAYKIFDIVGEVLLAGAFLLFVGAIVMVTYGAIMAVLGPKFKNSALVIFRIAKGVFISIPVIVLAATVCAAATVIIDSIGRMFNRHRQDDPTRWKFLG